jgi:hypothetical protein
VKRACVLSCLALVALLSGHPSAQSPQSAHAAPPHRGVDSSRFDLIRPLVEQAIAENKTPGAVDLIRRGD